MKKNFDMFKFEEDDDIWIGTNILSDHVRSRNVQIPSSCVFKILLSHCMIALLEMPKNFLKDRIYFIWLSNPNNKFNFMPLFQEKMFEIKNSDWDIFID